MRTHSLSLLALSMSLGACTGSFGAPDGVDVVRGTLGEVSFVGVPEVREVRVSEQELHVDLRILSPRGGAAMIGVTLPRELLEDGETYVYRTEEAHMIGCSGPEDESWEFDCHPTDYFVDVYDGKDALELDFEATFTGEDCGDLPEDAPEEGQGIDGSVEVELF